VNPIENDVEFKTRLRELGTLDQRLLAVRFVDHVMPLSLDDRIPSAMKVAADPDASESELSSALKTAKAATMDTHTRCGSEGDWANQAGYFVCRAAAAALSPAKKSDSRSPAWNAALSSRMARTSELIDENADEVAMHNESEWQYEALANYLNERGAS